VVHRTCTVTGCLRPHEAKGFCKTHYNQTLPNRYRKVEMACAWQWCTNSVSKPKRGARQPVCSVECRTRLTHGWREELPTDHWARMYGATCKWTAPVVAAVVRTYSCAWCGTDSETTQPHTKFCTQDCATKAARRRRRAAEHGAAGSFTWAQVVQLWISFGQACAYCATPTPLTELQAEHVHPLSRGGRNDLTNLLPSCGPCNADKRDLLLDQWAMDRTRRGLPPVHTSWSLDDPRYKHLVAALTPLTAAA
jgi:5-methylcytosine-specific restriction endonuclease McrA